MEDTGAGAGDGASVRADKDKITTANAAGHHFEEQRIVPGNDPISVPYDDGEIKPLDVDSIIIRFLRDWNSDEEEGEKAPPGPNYSIVEQAKYLSTLRTDEFKGIMRESISQIGEEVGLTKEEEQEASMLRVFVENLGGHQIHRICNFRSSSPEVIEELGRRMIIMELKAFYEANGMSFVTYSCIFCGHPEAGSFRDLRVTLPDETSMRQHVAEEHLMKLKCVAQILPLAAHVEWTRTQEKDVAAEEYILKSIGEWVLGRPHPQTPPPSAKVIAHWIFEDLEALKGPISERQIYEEAIILAKIATTDMIVTAREICKFKGMTRQSIVKDVPDMLREVKKLEKEILGTCKYDPRLRVTNVLKHFMLSTAKSLASRQ